MLHQYYIVIILSIFSNLAISKDISQTVVYQETSYLSCEKINSDSTAVWLKDSVVLDVNADPNLSITSTGSLVFDSFEFADTGTYQCQYTDINYILIIDCPANSDPNFVSNQCICSPGATSDTSSPNLKCDLCALGMYKSHPGNHQCFSCPTSLVTEGNGSISETSCVCLPGHGISSSMCVPCLEDTYQDKYEETPCVDCPPYSATPQPLGESDAEAFSSKSDCVCMYSPDNADIATCWPFITTPIVTMVEIETTAVRISWNIELYARADDGAYRGIIAGYHLEVIERNELMTNVFAHKYTPLDYTPEEYFVLTIPSLTPVTDYTIAVNAYTKSTHYEDGPPFYLNITTLSVATTTTVTTVTTATGLLGPTSTTTVEPTETTEPTDTTITTTVTTEMTTETTTEPTETTTEPTGTIAELTTTPPTESTTTTPVVNDTPKVIVRTDSTASSFLSVVVVLLALFIAVLVVLVVVRYWYGRRRRSKKLLYAQSSGAADKLKRIGPQARYPVYSNAAYLNADASDSYI